MNSLFEIVHAMGGDARPVIINALIGVASEIGYAPNEEIQRLADESPDELLTRTACEFFCESDFVHAFGPAYRLAYTLLHMKTGR